MAKKTAIHNENAPDLRIMFNWGLKISDFSELFLIAGLGDHGPDMAIRNPGDPVAQTEAILAELKDYVERNGYGLNDVIRIEFTLSKEVDPALHQDIFGCFAAFFAEVDVKPAAGTLRVVDALALPGMLVEYEIWLAKQSAAPNRRRGGRHNLSSRCNNNGDRMHLSRIANTRFQCASRF
ncbi:MAG: RidA family protein [Alphaproteobacteria bacterium]|nr:RidA family protein [Alphaproteobacteria bacterium]